LQWKKKEEEKEGKHYEKEEMKKNPK